MKKYFALAILGITMTASPVMVAQVSDDINVFGFFQAGFQHSFVPDEKDVRSSNTFSLQQMNLFFGKPLSSRLDAFVNLEFRNSYSSAQTWGSFELSEAWVSYAHSEALNVKAGLLVPTFNNLNEIKNKTVLLPYIFRPIVYESTIASLIDFTPFLPEQAFLQVNGTVGVGEALLDYAVHFGNSEKQLVTARSTGGNVAGWDTTTFKAVGGRVGVRMSGVKAGVSMTFDRDFHVSQGVKIGVFPRQRFGADLSYKGSGLSVEAEYIAVSDKLTPDAEMTLAYLNTVSGGAIGTSLERSFYYGNVAYDVTDDFFGFTGYSTLVDKSDGLFSDGMVSYSVGAGYRASNEIVVKGQVTHFELNNRQFFILDQNTMFVAVSVLF